RLLNFITLRTPTVTLTGAGLTFSAQSNALPLVGAVTFGGTLAFSGTFTIFATAPRFTLLNFITVDNARVELAFPNPTLPVGATVDLLRIGSVTFVGAIAADGSYTLRGSARLNPSLLGGFDLGEASMEIGSGPGSCVTVGPFTTPPLPVVGPVRFTGTYCDQG